MSNSFRNKVLGYTLSIIISNQLSPACINTINYNSFIHKTVSLDTNKHKLPNDFGTLEYLIYANSIAHEQSKGTDFCVEFSEKTFHAYQLLTKMNNRKDLIDKVRFVGGKTYGDGESVNHMWLQYKDKGGKITNFETTIFMPRASFEKIREISENGNPFNQEIEKIYLKSLWGSYFKVPQKDLIFYPGGLAGMFYDNFNKK
jgi:hypothetical protein